MTIDDEDKVSTESKFLIIALSLLIFIPASLWTGFVGHALWLWFIEPVFHIATPSVYMLAGVIFAVRFMINSVTQSTDITPARFVDSVIIAFAGPGVSLIFGWVLSFFILH